MRGGLGDVQRLFYTGSPLGKGTLLSPTPRQPGPSGHGSNAAAADPLKARQALEQPQAFP
jgi:hypothetical protein